MIKTMMMMSTMMMIMIGWATVVVVVVVGLIAKILLPRDLRFDIHENEFHHFLPFELIVWIESSS